ncbi:MAG: hypothetical protein A3I13_05030 [Gammaproteobacteria bacterium RIFCSPLOWO2_02_FULL_47_50]|nr:MAG: hypothetical protein A2W69_02945 [Gammaproteobacteria bacterium RIFCSPLOWO2_02_47_7]OGT66742.1 MAG: hypothetical protein A2993_00620 [Gammaproteobacteria bacterium RIFCSPLOWO2_01_FULL_47_190]OGT76055.1 MAG: hypothetical protein A2W76_01285 [Gammaproteobacteria bacterium RIFCSPLOWO2_12_47_11]OGT78937.1 MAG: hypothetical protein A3I13_05030 [Gammaproteobacteria bacterium RIFCSPLOWO2_02_FULL_47_50]OGT83335.1 MAG: hypothetical protein A3G42_02750 [Gammaproteobacteria bacterium RIFCSPLOWO2_1
MREKNGPGSVKGEESIPGPKYPAGETGIGTVPEVRTDNFLANILNKMSCESSIFNHLASSAQFFIHNTFLGCPVSACS